MKRILAILAVVASIFAVSSCDTAMHDGTSMYVTTVTISGLDNYKAFNYEGRTLVINGPFNGWSVWTTAACPSAVVSGGTATFTINTLISDPEFEYLIAPRVSPDTGGDYACVWDYKIGVSVNGDNAKVDNAWTGPGTDKTVTGTMAADGTVTWKVE
uniref:Uncharacterized protein n=1 Tax=Gracilinema caldarium TaxID=215591 RepID=A0A7C3EBY2_9SPIR